MHYMLQFYENPEERAKHNDPAQVEAYFAGWTAFIGTLAQSGAMVSGNGLLPPDTATTLRVMNGTRQVVDGPFADNKEILGGYVILDVPDLDAALDWAARVPLRDGRVGRNPPDPAAPRRLRDGARRDAVAQAVLAARGSCGTLRTILAARTLTHQQVVC